jgi:beta-xylosidase
LHNVIHSTSNKVGDEHDDQFIIHTTDMLSGNWTDPIMLPSTPEINPSLLFDDNKVYLQLCKVGPKFQFFNFKIDIVIGKMLAEPDLIWNGWAGGFTEGPHVYKNDGWYYLSCAEGGTFRHHMLSMARSKSIWGPYESYDRNPLYSADGTDEYVQNTGHGDFFQNKHGEWWVVMLGVRMDEGRCIMGRESFLAAVKLASNEWPSINTVAARRDLQALPGQTAVLQFALPSTNSAAWVYLRDPVLEDYRIQDRQVTMRARPAGLDSIEQVVSFVGQRQRRLIGTAGVTLLRPKPSQTSKS